MNVFNVSKCCMIENLYTISDACTNVLCFDVYVFLCFTFYVFGLYDFVFVSHVRMFFVLLVIVCMFLYLFIYNLIYKK